MPEQLKFNVEPEYDNMQAKRYLKQVHGLSARLITRLKNTPNGILMDGELLRAVDNVKSGSTITINLPEERLSEYIEPVKGELDIVYEDEFLLAVNKPPFMPVHPVKQHQTDTLANTVTFYAESRGESYVFRAHNRLDRDTSGIVLIAKDKFTINKLKNNVSKTYFALVHGKVDEPGTVAKPIDLREDSKMVRQVTDSGTPAVTH
jgi:23S rRNA pseudouridine1911/1915/1917 synthase